MISTGACFLFLHIPKCAGNSIQNALAPWSDDRIVKSRPHHDGVESFEVTNDALGTRKHSTLAEYRQKLPPELYRSLYKFTCVRNPWDRMLSHFLFKRAKRAANGFDRASFARFIETRPAVEHYVCSQSRGRIAHAATGDEFAESPFSEIDFYVRFEHLDEDFDVVRKELDIPFDALSVRNRGQHRSYAGYYDVGTRELVRRRFASEIDYFGYHFGG